MGTEYTTTGNYLALLCAVVMLAAVLFAPWVDLDASRALETAAGAPGASSALIPFEPLIIAAALSAAALAVWGIRKPDRRPLASTLTLAAGGVGLAYYLVFFYSNLKNGLYELNFIGGGFWLALLATLGLFAQALLTRRTLTLGRIEPRTLLLYAAFVVFAVVMLFPFYFIIASSFTPRYELFEIPPRYWPEHPTLANYPNMASAIPFTKFYVNSLIFAIGSTAVSVLVSAMAGYGLARLKFPGSNAVFFGLVMSIALPQVALLVPIREIYNTLGMNNTYHGLITLMSSLITPFTVWIMVSFVNQIPVEIEEAAYIDGANMWQTIIQIVFPAMRPAIATMLVINFIISWNELLYPLIFATRNDTKTLSVGLISLGREAIGTSRPWDLMSAMSVTMIVPVVILIIFGQRAIVSGLTRGAVK